MNIQISYSKMLLKIKYYIINNLDLRFEFHPINYFKNYLKCKKNFNILKKILKKNRAKNPFSIKDKVILDFNLLYSISAYIDNELTCNDNLKIKKLAIINPVVKSEIEILYSLKHLLSESYLKTKALPRRDLSKSIVADLKNNMDYSTTFFYKLATVFVFLISSIIISFYYLNF